MSTDQAVRWALRSVVAPAWIVFLTLVSTSGHAADAVSRLDRLLTQTTTLEAPFNQTVFDDRQVPIASSAGRVYLNRPGKFRWDYAEPAPHLIVADGESVWIYDRGLDQVTRRSIDTALDNTPAVLLTHVGSLHLLFRMKSLPERDGLAWVELVPRERTGGFEWVRLGFDQTQVRILEMADALGQTTRIDFATATVNAPLDPALFEFSAPADADLIQGQ